MDYLIEAVDTFWRNLQSGNFQEWGAWNYVILTLLVVVEGPIATLLGAAAASAGFMRLPAVFLAATVGNLLADTGWYALGYFSNEEWLLHYGRWLGLRRRHLERLQRGMRRHARKILIVAKLSAGFVIPTLIAAGLARVPLRRWLPIVFVGEMVWTTVLVVVGFYATEAIKRVEVGLHYLAIFGAIVIGFTILYLGRKRLNPEQSVGEDADEDAGPTVDQPAVQRPDGARMGALGSEATLHDNGSRAAEVEERTGE